MTSIQTPSDKPDTPLRLLHSDEDYRAALAAYEAFFDNEPEPGSEAGDRFELLGLVLAKYEAERYPIGEAEPADVIRLTMEGRGLTQADLARVLGSRSRASEVLSRRRDLTLNQIRRLRDAWRIPADTLLGAA